MTKEELIIGFFEKGYCCDLDEVKDTCLGLLKENQELKKQLENCYCNRTDCSGRIKDSKVYDSLVQKVETQQKEFINYLENMLDDENDIFSVVRVKDALQKYREIIGDDK